MAKTTKMSILPIEQVKFEEKFYPRNNVDWITVLRYKQAMEVGDKFPAITVASFRKRYILIDGAHRLQAMKDLKMQHSSVEVLSGLTEKEIYLEAVRRNVGHGRQFSGQERAKIILTLKEWKISSEQISTMIRIPVNKIEPFMVKKMVRINETQEIKSLKRPLSNMAGTSMSSAEFDEQEPIAGRHQVGIIESFLALLENNWINLTNPRIKELVQKIYDNLTDRFEEIEETPA